MMEKPNYKLIAIKIGDLLKYDTTFNEINRVASSVFNFQKKSFRNEDITSGRAQLIYDWILTLAEQEMNNGERNKLLQKFLHNITPPSLISFVENVLNEEGVNFYSNEALSEFTSRGFHFLIHKHCLKLFSQGNYFHAVFEAAKVYNKEVKKKANSTKDGYSLMMDVWRPEGVLKVTKCETETEKDVQNGLKFLSAGLMQAIRNPTAHEPALDWPISKDDCLDLLSFISFLLRQLDKAVYYKG